MSTPRPEISTCYDHLSGIAGEILTERLLELGWVTAEPSPGVTPLGWKGFDDLGLNLTPLMGSRRKPVAYCTEIRGHGEHHEHLGGHLGALVRQHFLQQGWLALAEGRLALTPAGRQVLEQLGVHLEVEP